MPNLSLRQKGWGRRKPGPWADVDAGHPLARGKPSVAYVFNEGGGTTAHDAAFNYNGGTLSAGASWVPGAFGGPALKFNGSSGSVTLATNPALTKFSIVAWLYVLALPGNGPIFDNAAPQGIYVLAAGQLSWFEGALHNSTGTVALNIWTQIGVTSDGTNLRLYLNGKLDTTTAFAATWPVSTLTVGSDTSAFYNGLVDHFLIWPRALLPEEVRWLYREPFAFLNTPPPTRAHSQAAVAAAPYVPWDIPHSPEHQSVMAM